MPRLAPRKQSRSVNGIENASPFLVNTTRSTSEARMGRSSFSGEGSSVGLPRSAAASAAAAVTIATRRPMVQAAFPPTKNNATSNFYSTAAPLSPVPNNHHRTLQQHDPESYRRRVLSNKDSSENNAASAVPPPPPSRMLLSSPYSHQQQQSMIKSPIPSSSTTDIYSDSSSFSSFSDCSLTPPVTGPRPLLISSKRVGNDVRRKHSKRRRCRSFRRQVVEGGGGGFGRGGKDNNETKSGGFCLWQDDDETTAASRIGDGRQRAASAHASSALDSSDEEDDNKRVRESLPFLFTKNEVSPIDRTRHYWEWCYGKGSTIELTDVQKGWSAKREPPAKGCLSHAKPKRHANPRFRTPPTSPEDNEEVLNQSTESKKNVHVQFGSPKAVEYEIDKPAGQLTPLPSHVTKERFSMDQKKMTFEEEEITEETKQNSALLAEWDESFEEPKSTSRRKRKKNRRSSSLFSPSPMVLAGGNDNNNDTKEEKQMDTTTPPRNAFVSNNTMSPSVVVSENLASLSMKSPEDAMHEGESTVEFRVDLNEVNSRGGAFQESPSPEQQQKFGPSGTPQKRRRFVDKKPIVAKETGRDLTPPPADDSLESIHSLGGALDHDDGSPPGAYHSRGCEKDEVADDQITRTQARFEAANRAENISVDIIERLLKEPTSDQEWNPADLLRNLIDNRNRGNPLETLSKDINIGIEGVRACLDDLVEDVKHRANTRAVLSQEESSHSRRLLSRELRHIEIKFIGDLTRTLKQSGHRVTSLLKEVKDKKDLLQRFRPKKVTAASLQRDINELRNQIRLQSDLLRKTEAVEAPFAAVLCQASSHIGLCGFRIEAYTGLVLHLSFEHAVGGIESKFVFDLQTLEISMSTETTKKEGGSEILVPVGHGATKFHRYFLNALVDNPSRLSRDLELLALDEQVLRLSKWLGRLDTTAIDLFKASNDAVLNINKLPSVSMSFSNGTVVDMHFDSSIANQNFAPSNVSFAGNFRTESQLPCISTNDYLQKVLRHCSSEVDR